MPSSGRPKKVARKEKSGSAPTKANSNQAKGGAKDTPNVNRSAKPVAQGRVLKASSETLRSFDGLSSQKLPERSGSGVALLRSIGSRAGTRVSMAGEKHMPLDSISEEAKYVITRLVRGLGSGHDASRQGYAATLVEAILIHKAGLNDVYLLIRDHLATSGDGHKVRTQSGALDSGRLSSTEEKHRMLGRCFGYLALVRAGLLAGSTASSAAARAAKAYKARMESMEQGGGGSVISLATNGSSQASAAIDDASASHAGKIAAAIAKDATFMAGKKEYMRPICGEVLAVLATALPWKTVQRFLLGPYGQLLGGKPSGWDGGLIAAVLALEEAWEASGKKLKKGGSSVPGPVVKLRQVLDDSESKPEGHSVVDAFARAAEESFPRVHPAWRRLLWRFARRGVLLPSRAGNAAPSGLPPAQPADAAAFRRFWGECVESRMLGTGNARERAAALIVVSATLPLCPPGSPVAPVVWSRATASTIAVATTGPGRARRSVRASESLKDASKLALEAVVKSATERAGTATSSTSSSSSSSSSSSASADSVDDFASGCMVALATGQGKGAAPAGVVKRAVGALQQLLTGEAIESYGSSVLARIQDPSKTSAERLDALRSAKELVLNLTGRASSAGAAAASASSDDGAVWLGSRQVSPSTLEFIYEALRSMVHLAVFQVDGESQLEGNAVRRCREQLAGLVAELAHRGSAPSDAIESSSPSAGAGAESSAEESAAESDAAPQEPKVQDLIDANARSALSWAGTCHSAIEAGLEGLAGVAEGGEGGFKPAALVPIPGGSAALRARQIALAVSSAFSEAAGALDAHGGPAVQQGRRLLLNGAAALSLSALACMVEVQDGSGEGGSDDDSDEEPEAGDLELCAATEDLAVALSKLLLPFLRAAADIEDTETSTGSKTPQKGKGKSKKSKKSPSKAGDADAAGAAPGVQSKIDAASAALEGAGLGAIGSESSEESGGPGPADSVELPCGDASKWLDGQRVKSADGKQDTFAVVADVVLVLLSRADSLTQEAANAALRSCSSFLSIEGLQTLLAPAESLALGKPMVSGEESDDDEMEGAAAMEDSSDDDSDDDDDDDDEDEEESGSEQKAKEVATPAASSGAGAGGDGSDSDSDSDLDQMQAEGEAAERAAAFIISTQRNQKRALAQARRARQAFVLRTLGAVEVLLRRVDGTPMSIYFGWPLLHLLLLAMRRAVVAAGDAAASGGRGEAREAQQASMALATRLGSLLRKACRCNGGSKAGWKAVVGDGKEGKEVLKLLVSDSVSCFELSKKSPGTDFLAAACDTAFLYVKAAKTVASAVGVDAEPSTWGLGREAADSLLRSVTEQAGHYLTKAGSKLSLLPVQTLIARSIDGSSRGKGGAASGAGADEAEQGGGQDLGFAWRLAPLLSHGSLHGRNDFRREECFKLAYQLCKATADAKAWADLQDMDLRSVAVEVQAKAAQTADGNKSAGDDATAGVAVSFAQTPFGTVASGLSNSLATTVVASTSSMLRASKKARKRVGDEDKAKVLEAAGGDFDKVAIKPSRLVAAATALRTMLRATSSRKSTEASSAAAAGLSDEQAATLSAASRGIYDGKLGGGALRNAARGCMMMLDGTSDSNGKAAVGKKRKRDDAE